MSLDNPEDYRSTNGGKEKEINGSVQARCQDDYSWSQTQILNGHVLEFI